MKIMADSLVLKGVKDVRKHADAEMQIVNPRRGGNTHQIKEWWRKSVNTTYTGCTMFKVTGTGGVCHLVLATGKPEYPEVRIIHDGAFGFTFSGISEIERAALYTEDFQLIEHYIFPSIAGGSIVTVKPAGSADRPTGAPPATQIDSVTISGEVAPTDGDTEVYSLAITGTVPTDSYTYNYTITGGTLVSTDASTGAVTVTWTSAGAGSVDVLVGSDDTNFDGNSASDSLSVNVNVAFSTLVSSADLSVAVTVADTGNGDKYQIDGVEQDGIVATAGATIHFDLSDASVSGHPFKIYTDSSKTTEVTVGISQQGTDLLFTPPIAGNFSYQCANHAAMGGDITVNA